jgi:hypothetical protein
MMGVDVVFGMAALHVFTFDGQLRGVYSCNHGYEGPLQIQTYLTEVEGIRNEGLLGLCRPLWPLSVLWSLVQFVQDVNS